MKRFAWLALLLAACRPQPLGVVLATVNGEPVTASQLEAERRFLQPQPPADADILEDLIDQALLRQQADSLGIRLDAQARSAAEEEARAGTDLGLLKASLQGQGLRYEQWVLRVHRAALIDELIRREVRVKLDISPQEIQDRYWERLPSYRSPERRVLRQIYCRHRAGIDKALDELELGEPFNEVAARRGEGPEAAQSGLLGAVTLRALPKSLAEAAAKLKPGERSKVIASHWGYHILLYEAKQPAGGDSLENAAPYARAEILREKEQVAYQAYLARLREQAKIERPSPQAASKDHP